MLGRPPDGLVKPTALLARPANPSPQTVNALPGCGPEGYAPRPPCYCLSSGSSVYGSWLPDLASPREMK